MNIIERYIEDNIPIGKECIIYGVSETGKRLLHFLEITGRKIKYLIDDFYHSQTYEEYEICGIETLIYEEDALVILGCASLSRQKLMKKKVIDMGISESNILVFPFWPQTELNVFDPLVGPAPQLEYAEYSKDDSNKLIMVYGGSTSEDNYSGFDCWSKILFKMPLVDINIKNGAVRGYTSLQEMRKCVRDVLIAKPQIVISFSGVNDALSYAKDNFVEKEHILDINEYFDALMNKIISNNASGFDTISNGLADNRARAQRWIDNIKIMHAVCNENNIKFYCFIQPIIVYGKYKLSEFERKLLECQWGNQYSELVRDFYTDMCKLAEEYDYIINITDCLECLDDAYIDLVHYAHEANKAIACVVWDKIKEC